MYNKKATRFIKCHSLQNNFILFDVRNASSSSASVLAHDDEWYSSAQYYCNRQYGICADGVLLILSSKNDSSASATIFNSDGSAGNVCFNGIRCLALYLCLQEKWPFPFSIEMGGKKFTIPFIEPLSVASGHVEMHGPSGVYKGEKTILEANQTISGHIIDVGNPHFIIRDPYTSDWLRKFGPLIEKHPAFPHKTNVSIISAEKDAYYLITHERGCGITQACSSAAYACVTMLYAQKQIFLKDKVTIVMPGGKLNMCLLNQQTIKNTAQAHLVFGGKLF